MSRFNILLLLILAGLLIFAQQDSALEDKFASSANIIPTVAPTATPTPTPVPEPKNFSIPKINVFAPVAPVGVDETGKMELPQNINEVGWYSLGFKPGEPGNAVIAGHLDSTTGEGAIFYHLHELEPGDDLYVTDQLDNQYRFVVTRKVVYEYDKVPLEEIFGESPKKGLNLITCTGQWIPSQRNYSHRMVIYSELQSVSRFHLSPTE